MDVPDADISAAVPAAAAVVAAAAVPAVAAAAAAPAAPAAASATVPVVPAAVVAAVPAVAAAAAPPAAAGAAVGLCLAEHVLAELFLLRATLKGQPSHFHIVLPCLLLPERVVRFVLVFLLVQHLALLAFQVCPLFVILRLCMIRRLLLPILRAYLYNLLHGRTSRYGEPVRLLVV